LLSHTVVAVMRCSSCCRTTLLSRICYHFSNPHARSSRLCCPWIMIRTASTARRVHHAEYFVFLSFWAPGICNMLSQSQPFYISSLSHVALGIRTYLYLISYELFKLGLIMRMKSPAIT
jgi:hypothetical protein